jgi:predicted transcriptional regulator
MTAPSPKQLALQAVEQLPDNASLEDAMERLYVLESLERGRADAAAGRTVEHQEVRRRLGLS